MATSTVLLAQQIEALRRRMDSYARTPQLGYSAIDNGSLAVKDGTGQLTTIIGQQYDGTSGAVVVAGPPPPIPDGITLAQALGGVEVTWDGSFVDPQPGFTAPVVAPMDFLRIEVEVSNDVNFPSVGFLPKRVTIPNGASGGTVFVPWETAGEQLYSRLRTRSTAGRLSDPGQTVGPIASGKVQLGDLGFDISNYTGGTTIYYGTVSPTPPAGGFGTGDLWLKDTGTVGGSGQPLYLTYRWIGASWQLLQDQSTSQALANAITAQNAANAKATVFRQTTAPTYSGAANTAIWYDTDDGNRLYTWSGTVWTSTQLGNGAISPNTLIASNVIATGTITAALLETLLVLTTSVIAGNSAGTHAAMTPDGFHVYDNSGDEVIRLGTTTDDYFGVVNSSHQLVASVDDTGQGNFSGLNVVHDPLIMGTLFSDWVGNASGAGNGLSTGDLRGAQNYYGYVVQTGSGITSEVGLHEIGVYVDASRQYLMIPEIPVQASSSDGVCQIGVRDKQGTGNFTGLTDQLVYFRSFPIPHLRVTSVGMPGLYRPTVTGNTRLLLTMASGGSGTLSVPNNALTGTAPVLTLIDLGPAKGINATQNNITAGGTGGSSAQPKQQYYVELAPGGYISRRGDGSLRSDTTDVVQGYDPSGYNGDGYGYWSFSLPSITGTVDRVDFYVYTNLTYYNSGGTAILNILHSGTDYPESTFEGLKLRGDWQVGGYPKPGGKTVTLPSDWWPFFRNAASPRAGFVSVGNSDGSNLAYYCRFAGTSARLRIWYTQ